MSDPVGTEKKRPTEGIALRYAGIALCMLAAFGLVVRSASGDDTSPGQWFLLLAGIGVLGLSYLQKIAAR